MADLNRIAEAGENNNAVPCPVLMPDLKGVVLINALAYLKELGLNLGTMLYEEADCPAFTVVKQSIAPGTEILPGAVVNIKLAGINPIKFLPSIYQSNPTLKNFLFIFYHVLNSITFKLDNIHRYFNPMEAPKEFYRWLASWFSINVNFVISEAKIRHLIKNAVILHQWRGTLHGLSRYLEILTDVRPEILEHFIPHSEYTVKSDKLVENYILARKTSKYHFTISFPVPADHFDFETIKSIYQVVESEKPAHADFYIIFSPGEKEKVKSSFIIGEDIIQ